MVVVEVRQGAGGEETRRGDEEGRGEERRGGGGEEEEEKEEDEEEEDEEEATDIKSNNPHLAGEEKHMFQTTNQAKDIHIKSYFQSLRPTCSSVTNNSDDYLG